MVPVMSRAALRRLVLLPVLTALLVPSVEAAPSGCIVEEGVRIGGVRIGMRAAEALAVTGPPVGEQRSGQQVAYALRTPWAQMVVRSGLVHSISTTSPACRTTRGIAPGDTSSAVRDAYAGSPASALFRTAEGDRWTYPFGGVAFLLRQDRVEVVEIFRPEELPGARPAPTPRLGPGTPAPPPGATPAPPPAPTGAWSIRSSTARVEEAALVVTGTVENRGRAMSVYVEVRAFSGTGRPVGQADAPVHPNPVPNGGSANFEVRLSVEDAVRRYVVIVRPIGSLAVTLAESMSEVKDLQQFAPVVARSLRAVVEATGTPAGPDNLVVVVTNGSSLTVAQATLAVEVTATCRIPLPAPRTIQEIRTGSVTVQQLRPGASGRARLALASGACLEFTTWSAEVRVGEVRIGD